MKMANIQICLNSLLIEHLTEMNYKLKFKEGELYSDGRWTKI